MISALAQASTPQQAQLPEWLKISFEKPSFFSDLYKNSIAQGIYLRMSKKSFLPPVQYLSRPLKSDLNIESENVARLILENLGVSSDAKKTFRKRFGPVKAGEKRDLQANFMEFQSNDKDAAEPTITCMVFVKTEGSMQVVYTQAFMASLPNCTEELLNLARNSVLFN